MSGPKTKRPNDEQYEDHLDDCVDDDDCWNCGGEGFVSNCFEEFACIDPEGGCDLCTKRCDVCNLPNRIPDPSP